MSPDLLAVSAALQYGSESVRSVMNSAGSQNRFTRAFEALERLAQTHDIPIAIVGGLGAIRYGYPAITEDIDIAISSQHLQPLVRLAPDFGFQVAWKAESGWHTLTFGDVEINVVPGPRQLGVDKGLGYANVAGWVELKISAWRRKDQTHVVEVLKKCSPETIVQIQEHLASVHQDYATRFAQLVLEADQERQQEDERRR